MTRKTEIYCDGGVIGRNPSKMGVTWAWCLVENDDLIRWDSGWVEPADAAQSPLTNNFSELYAAVRAVIDNPDAKVLFTDSQITLYRMTRSKKFNGIPNWLRRKALKIRGMPVKLLAGHPTFKELEQGFADRNRNPVSKWNVFCDLKCQEAAKDFQAALRRKADNQGTQNKGDLK